MGNTVRVYIYWMSSNELFETNYLIEYFGIFRYVPIYIIPISISCTRIDLQVQTTCSLKEQLRRIFKIKHDST